MLISKCYSLGVIDSVTLTFIATVISHERNLEFNIL